MDSHTRYSMLQPSISASTPELWNSLSQSLVVPSQASSSFPDLQELGIFDPLKSSNFESNLKSMDVSADRDLKIGNIQRKLSLEFLNSNCRDVESDLVYWADHEEKRWPDKDAASSLHPHKKPNLHNMSTVYSVSPLPASGELPGDLGVQNQYPGFEQGRYQAYVDQHNSNMYYQYPSHQHVYTNSGYTSQVPYTSARDSSSMVTVSRDSTRPNLRFMADDSGSNSHTVHGSNPSQSTVETISHYPGSGQLGTTSRHQFDTRQHTVIKSTDHPIREVNYHDYGCNSEFGASYYDSSPTAPTISSTTYGYHNRSLQDSSAASGLINRQFAVTSRGKISHCRVFDQSIQKVNGAATNNPQANQCHICRKTYGRSSTLKTHVRIHLGVQPYLCQVCGKSFTQPANLTAHIRVHSGEKPFSCVVCSRHFSQSSSLKTHMRTHSGERPYLCNICKKSFTDSSTLTKHRRTHTGEKPYQCTVCQQQFSQSGNLKRHSKVHVEVQKSMY